MVSLHLFITNFSVLKRLMIYLPGRERECGGGQRRKERERERIPGRLPAEHRAQRRAGSQDPGMMIWLKSRVGMLNQLSHPDTQHRAFIE